MLLSGVAKLGGFKKKKRNGLDGNHSTTKLDKKQKLISQTFLFKPAVQ